MSKKIFRKVALERLSSPEQLDTMIKITAPFSWVALIVIGGILVVALFWGMYGSIPTRVKGQGILLKSGGIFDVASLSSGQLIEISVGFGDTIKENQIVARVSQPNLVDQINSMTEELIELKTEFEKIKTQSVKDMEMQKEHIANQKRNILDAIKLKEIKIKLLEKKEKDQKQLLKHGLITKREHLETREEINFSKQEIEKLQNEMKRLSIQEFQMEEQLKRKIREATQEINSLERKIKIYQNNFEIESRVVSPYSGRVLEVTKKVGETLHKGEPLLILESTTSGKNDLEAVIYISATEGKKIKMNMKAQISPSTVKQEEFGFIIGKVSHVAEFPSTSQRMMSILQNEKLVEKLSMGAAPIEVYAGLLPDPATISGFKWSSPEGPPLSIESGTICTASITIYEQSPLSLVIPLLKKKFLGVGQTDLTQQAK